MRLGIKQLNSVDFGQLLNCSATTEEPLEVECFGETLPEQFMDGDSSSGEDKTNDSFTL